MKILRNGKSKNFIVTIAIGPNFYQEWVDYVLPSWLQYCEKNELGLAVVEHDLVERTDPCWKKATWQKLLIGREFLINQLEVKNVCFLDADILVNPFAPNVFDGHDDDKISLVSQTKTPFDYSGTLRKIAYNRNKHLSEDYPLDSSLFMSKKDYFHYHGFEEQNDIFCAGFFIFNVNNFSEIMERWFFSYPSNIETITNCGDEPVLNFEFQNYGKIKWLDYKFQSLWLYEMAEKYAFLYSDLTNTDLVKQCIRSSLRQNYFLHFAGKWEGSVYKDSSIIDDDFLQDLRNFNDYLGVPVSGKPVGLNYPKES